ncbi:hypothetical protein [Mesorhizobium sp. B2-6-4]|uniref:hypothetical protein n=1 Tax=Mesorhizobium sp. B2-6-4 TaxID=2589913 RepID=UPI0011290A7F|nr:hypothetical protein [Mesorhizobium sp. B2-6-4]TPJ52714.1 hypothetical protein FJ426_15790 [Mesorhizobium sp. B2-6-4]
MSRTTVLQIIAAVITVAVLAVLHRGLDWFLSSLEPRFMMGLVAGFLIGTFSVLLIWYFEDRKDKSLAPGGRTREQQRARNTIDL